MAEGERESVAEAERDVATVRIRSDEVPEGKPDSGPGAE